MMASGGSRRRSKSSRPVLWVVGLVVAGLIGIVLFHPGFERNAPQLELVLEGDSIGTAPLELRVTDEGQGLRSLSVQLVTDDDTLTLVRQDFGESVFKKLVTLDLKPHKKSIREGAARLVVIARDYSWWPALYGETVLDRPVQIDLTPPRVEVLSTEHYVNHGGSGLVIYRVSETVSRSGVQIGDYFFPGSSGFFEDRPAIYVAIFAFPYDVPHSARLRVVAEDAARNTGQATPSYTVRKRRYRKRQITVSDDFIESTVLPLLGVDPEKADYETSFLKVNRDMRAENARRKREVGAESASRFLWTEPFHQLSNSKVEASFADARDYFYKQKKIDKQYHLGFDLAVTKRYPVEAANVGRVVYADDLGIYGNTVILDHGLGVFTLYAHMSTIDVKVGEDVVRKQPIGRTGATGLAGGDHLHYEVMVRGVPVLPLEWWDRKWLKDNIFRKIDAVREELAGR